MQDSLFDTSDYIRKIIKVGPKSMAIVLPKEWINKNSLNPGESVILKIHNNNLIISPTKNIDNKVNNKFEIDINRSFKDGVDINSVILCGLIKGMSGVLFKNANEDSINILKTYGYLLDIDTNESYTNIRFIINDLVYDEELLLKHMLSVIVQLIDSISKYMQEREPLDNAINIASIEIKKYGYILARKLLTSYKDSQPESIIEFSTGLVLGLISELLLVDVISLKNEEIDPRGSIILNIIFNKIEQVLQEAIGGLIYRSSSRSKKAKILLENLKKTMKSVRLYSSISDITLIEQIARLDAIVRLINKLVDMSLCNTIESISSR
ncbi:AbrB/MazE/SpoVT family DNA-binding domain-containing protein [Caldisphaera sp.]|uniref:AbrB/MazE/SpoVT family DNA-binding domain-containing protein n=1 Tax=Caldisphaera sp. TaxID=2060322 RepID=UPI00397E26AC